MLDPTGLEAGKIVTQGHSADYPGTWTGLEYEGAPEDHFERILGKVTVPNWQKGASILVVR
jgi:hypothetical protein